MPTTTPNWTCSPNSTTIKKYRKLISRPQATGNCLRPSQPSTKISSRNNMSCTMAKSKTFKKSLSWIPPTAILLTNFETLKMWWEKWWTISTMSLKIIYLRRLCIKPISRPHKSLMAQLKISMTEENQSKNSRRKFKNTILTSASREEPSA